MKILKNHIASTIIIATTFVMLVLVGLQIFITFIGELGDLGTAHYGIGHVLYYVILTLPANVYQFFPMAGLLGALLGLGYLATNSELIVMRTAGVSLWQIVFAVFYAALLMLLVMTFLGEVIAPFSTNLAFHEKAKAMQEQSDLTNSIPLWLKDQHRFIHIDNINTKNNGHLLKGITEFQFNDQNQLVRMFVAQKAILKNKQFWLENIHQTTINGDTVSVQNIEKRLWPIHVKPTLLNVSTAPPDAMNLVALAKMIYYRHLNGLRTESQSLLFWQRLAQPFATLVMIFLAIPFIFGPLRSVPMGVRVVSGVILGFVFYLANQFFGPVSVVYQLSPVIGAFFPSLLFLLVSAFFLRKVS